MKGKDCRGGRRWWRVTSANAEWVGDSCEPVVHSESDAADSLGYKGPDALYHTASATVCHLPCGGDRKNPVGRYGRAACAGWRTSERWRRHRLFAEVVCVLVFWFVQWLALGLVMGAQYGIVRG